VCVCVCVCVCLQWLVASSCVQRVVVYSNKANEEQGKFLQIVEYAVRIFHHTATFSQTISLTASV
jgi:hypothetical protein